MMTLRINKRMISTLALLLAVGNSTIATAAPLFSDLTESATLTESGHYNIDDSENLRDGNFYGTGWITDSATETWAKYSWGTAQYLGYALLGGNVSRVPDGMKVQYSVNDDGVWIDAGTVAPATGNRLYYVPIAETAQAVRVLITRAVASYSDLSGFYVYGSATAPSDLMSTASDMMANAAVVLTGLWEDAPADVAAAWSDQDGNGIVPRANGDMASKPQAILTWATHQQISGLALVNGSWSYSGGAIFGMTIEALTEGVEPSLATPSDWSAVFDYSDAGTGVKLIDARFASGSVTTRSLRLTVTDVQDIPNNPSRAGGVITEIALLGGLIPPLPPTGTLISIR